MPGTYKKIDYRLRPAKHAERIMLIDLFKRMRFAPIETYQYVGFGSVAFVDFRMVHKWLGISDLVSIEQTDDPDEQLRFTRNNPYAGLDLHFGHSSKVLSTLDFKKRSLVWLDYDVGLCRSIANDIATIGRTAQSGTFIGVTFTDAFPRRNKKNRDKSLKFLKDEFSDFVPEDARAVDFDGAKYAEFGRSVLGALLQKSVSDADAGEADPAKRRLVHQLCFFKYADGAPMVTVGWIVVAEQDNETLEICEFGALPYVRTAAVPFRIKIPLVTPFEISEMERRLPDLASSTDLNWIPKEERDHFNSIYRYLPQFSVVEQS